MTARRQREYKKTCMKINEELLDRLCRRAGLILSQEERRIIHGDLKKALSHFETISRIDTKGIPPLVSPFAPPLKMREDQPADFPEKERLLEQAPERQGRLVKAPPIN